MINELIKLNVVCVVPPPQFVYLKDLSNERNNVPSVPNEHSLKYTTPMIKSVKDNTGYCRILGSIADTAI